MKKNIQISIAKPCHEKWSSFTPTGQGGFCSSCEKEVIDFTSWSEERLKMYFKNMSGNMCGRFRQEQLKVYEFDKPVGTSLGWLPVFFTGILLLFSSQQSKAQGTIKPKPQTEQYEPEKKTMGEIATRASSIKVSGVVKSAHDGDELMQGVTIARKGTEQGTFSDADGKFTLNIENAAATEVLIFNFIGYKTMEYSIPVTQNETEIVINMPMVADVMGDFVTIGGVGARPKWYSPKRWWMGVKRLF